MAKLTAYQQGLLDRYKKAREDGDLAKAAIKAVIEESKRIATQAAKDQEMYATALEREGLSIDRLLKAEPKQDAEAIPSETNGHGANTLAVAGFNKTHAVIDIFQRFGDQGLGPTEAWNLAKEIYPKPGISRMYVNTLVGKLKDRELIAKDEESGKYVLTSEGKNFQVTVITPIFENHNGEK